MRAEGFGRFQDLGWLINYDAARLDSLIRSSGLQATETRFFGWLPGGWQEVSADDLSDKEYQSSGAAHAAGVALVELQKAGIAK